MDELENKAFVANAELQSGDGVFGVAVGVGAPFDVEADDEAVELVAVGVEGVGDEFVDYSGGVGDKRVDLGGVECDCVG